MKSAFNTDTDALKKRADANAAKGKYDLEEWILQQIPTPGSLRILDLGCGVGKQLFRLAPLVTDSGSLLGIDLSEDAVRTVTQRAKAEGITNIVAQKMSLDECVASLAGLQFDLIMSSYAIYYATDTVALLQGLRTLLRDAGSVFVCGPGSGTNREIIDIVDMVARRKSEKPKPIEDFLSSAQIKSIAPRYSRVRVSRLENVIEFDSSEALIAWWVHHNSFVPAIAEDVRKQVNAYFSDNQSFCLTKNVIGVRFDA